LIGKRIRTLGARLQKVKSQLQQGAKQRVKSRLPVISLIGYTNSGKSTLFNRLTGAGVYAADKLFATLDPTLRRCEIAPEISVILADTVGFIRHIPHDLIEAFHATLEETREADLLLHIIDAHNVQRHTHIEQVNEVIRQIGAGHVPQIEVYNKIDLQDFPPRQELADNGQPGRIWLSARTGTGVDLLCAAIIRFISAHRQRHRLCLPPSAGKLRAHLFDIGAVYNEQAAKEGGWVMEVGMKTPELRRLCEASGLRDIGLQ
jgi:GTP-binding protein HflX